MTDQDSIRLQKRGKVAELRDEAIKLSREFANLMRPLRDRCNNALPLDQYPSDIAQSFDAIAANQELESVVRVTNQINAIAFEHDQLAQDLGLPKLRK